MCLTRHLFHWLGWKTSGTFPDIPKSVIVVAPHTTYWDGWWGYLTLQMKRIPYTILADAFLFKKFPFNIMMKVIHAIPVNVRGNNAIHQVVDLLGSKEAMHVVICPEGQLAPRDKWPAGFYHMARLAGVPIVVVALDYRHKTVHFKSVITDLSDPDRVFRTLIDDYQGKGYGRFPEKFLPPTGNLSRPSGGSSAPSA